MEHICLLVVNATLALYIDEKTLGMHSFNIKKWKKKVYIPPVTQTPVYEKKKNNTMMIF